jgi:hypothetical protein
MVVRRLLMKKLTKRLGTRVGARTVSSKAMSSAQRSALNKAVKASALARRKVSTKFVKNKVTASTGKLSRAYNRSRVQGVLKPKEPKLSKIISNQRLTGKQKRDFIKRYTNPKDFKGGLTNGKVMTPKQQAKNLKSIMKAEIRRSNSILKAQSKAVRRAERASAGGIDVVSSIGWSVALTAAFNPEYTMAKLNEAKNAIKQRL